MPASPVLGQLYALAERDAERSGHDKRIVFDPIGLILSDDLGDNNYGATPLNAWSFARTGGDGVHYSVLEVDGLVRDESPVVMSVPMMGVRGNMIIGENLREFLCLGCQVGYVWLEQLVYDRADTIARLSHPEPATDDPEEIWLLRLLSDEFKLLPWTSIEVHLDELQQHFMPWLKIDEEYM